MNEAHANHRAAQNSNPSSNTSWLKRSATVVALSAVAVLTGCASVSSGIGGTEKFACSAPNGVSCLSISGISENINAGTLPSLNGRNGGGGGGAQVANVGTIQLPVPRSFMTPVDELNAPRVGQTVNILPSAAINKLATPNTGTPLRTPEQVVRIWMAPFEDTDGDLHDQKYIYLTLNSGQWQLDAIRTGVKRPVFQQVRPISAPDAAAPAQRQGINPSNAAADVVRSQAGGGTQNEN